MKYIWPEFGAVMVVCLLYLDVIEIKAKSIKIHTSKPKPIAAAHQHQLIYPRVKVRNPSASYAASQREDVIRPVTDNSHEVAVGSSSDIIQNTFNSGLKEVFKYFQKFVSKYVIVGGGNEIPHNNEKQGSDFRLPGLPTTPLFHHLNVSSVVKLLEATDAPDMEILAEAAVVDIVSQLISIIGFNDLRDWLGIVLMYFLLGPILIPLFWLPISLFGMAGLLAPLFFFNPPSKLNTDVLGHDPILERALAKRSMNIFSSNITSSASNQFPMSAPGIVESCMERVSCHFTRFYRDNLIAEWLTRHFNTTKVEWARAHPKDDINGNGISSWEDCKKYVCPVFPAA